MSLTVAIEFLKMLGVCFAASIVLTALAMLILWPFGVFKLPRRSLTWTANTAYYFTASGCHAQGIVQEPKA